MVVAEAAGAGTFWKALLAATGFLAASSAPLVGADGRGQGALAAHGAGVGELFVEPNPVHAYVGGGSTMFDHEVAWDGNFGTVRRHFDTDSLKAGMDAAAATVPAAAVHYYEAFLEADVDAEYLSKGYMEADAHMLLAGYQADKVIDEWGQVLTKKMQDLDKTKKLPDVNVDDHDGTPIGEGDTIGVLGAEVSMDAAALADLPAALRTGLLQLCNGDCAKWPGMARFSHTNAGVDLLRIALKFQTQDGVVDLHFTETLKTFPMANAKSLEAFIYMQQHGTAWGLAKHPLEVGKMGLATNRMKQKYEAEAMRTGAVGKNYHSLTPFAVGKREDGGAVSAMKFRLQPQQHQLHPTVGKGGNVKAAFRDQFISDVREGENKFDLMIQVATDKKLHPINDATVEWDEIVSPWVKVGEVRLPQQEFPKFDDTPGNAITAVFGEHTSKDFLFAPGSNPHTPVGDINAFRARYYPEYDRARQQKLLGKDGTPSKCPFAQIAKAFR